MKEKLMDMEKTKKAFLLTGVLVLILAVLDVIKIIAIDAFGQLRNELLTPDVPTGEKGMYETAIWIAIVIIVLFYLIHFYLGVKAIRISKKPTDGKFHIILATVCSFFNFIALVNSILNFELMFFLLSLSSTVVMILYVYEARNIRNMTKASKAE